MSHNIIVIVIINITVLFLTIILLGQELLLQFSKLRPRSLHLLFQILLQLKNQQKISRWVIVLNTRASLRQPNYLLLKNLLQLKTQQKILKWVILIVNNGRQETSLFAAQIMDLFLLKRSFLYRIYFLKKLELIGSNYLS